MRESRAPSECDPAHQGPRPAGGGASPLDGVASAAALPLRRVKSKKKTVLSGVHAHLTAVCARDVLLCPLYVANSLGLVTVSMWGIRVYRHTHADVCDV